MRSATGMEWERVHDICIVGRRRGAGGSRRRGGGAYIRHATVPSPALRPSPIIIIVLLFLTAQIATIDCFL